MDAETMLWYEKPAENFDQALPIGNGRIGAMVFGGAADEVLKLNEDSVWSGGKRNRNNPDAREGLEEVRKLLREERIPEAEKIAFEKLQGVTPNSRHYMPLGDLNLHMDFAGKAKQYQRSLDLEHALATVRFTANDITYVREAFVSEPDRVLVLHIAASEPGMVNLRATLDGRDDYYDDCRPCTDYPNMLVYDGGTGSRNGIFFAAALTGFSEGGTIRTVGGALEVQGANEVTLLLSVGTSFYHGEQYEDAAKMDASYAADCSYEELLYRHLTEYQEKFRRVRFTLPDNSEGGSELPTDERLMRLRGERGRPQGVQAPDPRQQAGSAVLQLRQISDAVRQPSGNTAHESPGHLEPGYVAGLGLPLYHQHQHPDELLAGRGLQFVGMPPAAVRSD